jgi:hypothetical protein
MHHFGGLRLHATRWYRAGVTPRGGCHVLGSDGGGHWRVHATTAARDQPCAMAAYAAQCRAMLRARSGDRSGRLFVAHQ